MALTLLTCNYNTPNLIPNLIKSTKKFSFDFEIFVVDTGKDVTYNYADIHIPECPHGEAVNEAVQWFDSDHILLVDSDVIFYKDIAPIYQKFIDGGFALMGNVSGDRGGKSLYPRVDPWFCFINYKELKQRNIKFFDPERTKNSRNTDRVYDIGSTMFEDVVNSDLLIANFNGEGKYFKHYEGMSWRTNKFDPTQVDTDIDFGGTHNNKALYEYGLLVEQQYNKDIKTL